MAVRDLHSHGQERVAPELLDDGAQRVPADLGVAPHDLPLVLVQGSLLEQDRVGDAHLADVMKGARFE
jgi:hypothetical protein